MTDAILELRGLSKHFGGIPATDQVDLRVRRGGVHAIIGPNGAGKTTLIAQLSGALRSDSGQVLFDGRDVTRQSVARRARLGLARSFQMTSVIQPMTLLENVMLAVQGVTGHSFRFWRPVRRDAGMVAAARQALTRVGLAQRADCVAAQVSHGERRQLEVAMALAMQPKLLLLDEPMAGMGKAETRNMVEWLRSVVGPITILMVEHDMDAVFSLADRISVLVAGRVIATDTAAAIRANRAVQRAYLGDRNA